MSTSRRFIILLLYGVAACAVAARTGGVKDSAAPGGSARGGSARAAAEADRRKLQRSRPTESPKEPTRIKTVMGYIHPRYLRKGEEAGFGAVGEASHLNIDWELYDIVAYAGFGVASDGSIHSAEYRTENINEDASVQQPAPFVNTDPFTSGEMHLLYGELEYWDEIPPEYPWYEVDPDTGGWVNWKNASTAPRIGAARAAADAHRRTLQRNQPPRRLRGDRGAPARRLATDATDADATFGDAGCDLD
eukprot:Selendium_serpulae@DN6008_c0_g1_i3.p1